MLSLIKSRYHEERMLAVLMLVDRYARGDDAAKQQIFHAYIDHRRYVNNWDLVDVSAHRIVGPHLEHRSRELLYDLAASESIWDRRIAVLSTFYFIRNADFKDALRLARILRDDDHDLIHKAVGWMLREIGNRDRQAEVAFLGRNYDRMPRTMLRYAIEKFPATERKAWLDGTV